MLVVRKRGGRNLNNDRYVSINVDDHPAPIAELRRLLDLNLGLLYSQKVGPLLISGNMREARDAAAQGARYTPAANSYYTLGMMDFSLGERAAAAADFRKMIALDPAMRERLKSPPDSVPPGGGPMGRALRQILEDKEFVRQDLGGL